jgi:hypothetical protein
MGKSLLSHLTSASFFLVLCFFFDSFSNFFGGGLGSFCTFFSFFRFLVSLVWRPNLKSSSPATLDRVWWTARGVYSLLASCSIEVCNYMHIFKEWLRIKMNRWNYNYYTRLFLFLRLPKICGRLFCDILLCNNSYDILLCNNRRPLFGSWGFSMKFLLGSIFL